MFNFDAQAALGFLISQTAHIETQVYETQYPDIQYPELIPIDTSANEWAKIVTFFSSDKVGQASWFNHLARDVPRADVVREQHNHTIEMAAIGYGYTLEELGTAMLIPGTNLNADKASAAARAYEEFMDGVAMYGSVEKGWTGLINDPNVDDANVAADGTGDVPFWQAKTPVQILRDINNILTAVYVGSNTVEYADTLLLPVAMYSYIAGTARSDLTGDTIMDYIMRANVYTARTGQPLTIRAVRGLESAGAGGTGRMVAYRRDPQVVKLHLPMPHRFLPVWQTGPMLFEIPGIFRTGGTEIRRPGAFRYRDGINAAA